MPGAVAYAPPGRLRVQALNDTGFPKAAVVSFASARQAQRRIAGVPAAARVVRALGEAGLTEISLAIPDKHVLRPSFHDEVRRLACSVKVEIGPVDGGRGRLLSGDRMVPATSEILKSTGKAGDGPVSRWLNRPVSRRISAVLLRVPGIRPLHATLGTAMLAALMFAALLTGSATGLIAGAILFHAASVFDGVDGEIARATFRSSHAGAVIDSVIDVATNVLFIIGIAVHLAGRGEAEALALAAWGFALFAIGLGIIAWRSVRTGGPFSLDLVKHDYRGRFSLPLANWLIEAMTVVSSRDFFALLFALLVLAGLPEAVLYLFAAAATLWIMFVVGSLTLRRDPPLASSDFLRNA